MKKNQESLSKKNKNRRKDWDYIVRNLICIAEPCLPAWFMPLLPIRFDSKIGFHLCHIYIIITDFSEGTFYTNNMSLQMKKNQTKTLA